MSSAVNTIAKLISNKLKPLNTKQAFTDVSMYNNGSSENMDVSQLFVFFIVFILLLFIIIVLGTIIFNMTIPRIVPSIRKVSTIEFFGLYVILHILFN